MGLIYPDNPKRMVRVHQLVDSVTNLQADLKGVAKQMDAENARYRPAIDALLKAHGMATADEVINAAAAKLTPDEQKVFETLIKTNQSTKSGFDTTYFIAGLLMAPASVVLTGKMVISIAQWGSRMVNVANLANFITASEGGEAAAAEALLGSEAEEAAEALDGVSEAAEAAEVAADVAEAASIVGSLSAFLDVLAGVGLVVGLIAGALQIFEGAEQKKKLVNAIHRLQPARLTTALFDRMGASILDQLTNLGLYFDASPGGAEPDARIAAKASFRFRFHLSSYSGSGVSANEGRRPDVQYAAKIIAEISADNSKIDVGALESELEVQDRKASNFYGGADLSHDAVVAETSKA
ncbi:hypothetical protein GSI_11364 [Ganoderma sinense ZZ0214-1]|uniref:Uncharacterized protein n=1 Tax=Ganoderma sinense ZZ0214-1 TaxID=1077348 RepID=A0A2G8RVS5_9APHY|nr:hypothetical protein GSI_11364 [Ganoderma sinense ZZ0214-1]